MSESVEQANRHSQEVQELESKRRTQLDELRKSYKGQLATKDVIQKDRIDTIRNFNQKEKQENEKAYNTRLDYSSKYTQEEIQNINNRHGKKLVKMKKKFTKEKKEMNTQFEKELKNLRTSYQDIIDDRDKVIKELKYQKKYDVDYLSKNMHQKYTELEESYVERLEEIQERHEKEMTHLENKMRSHS